MKKQMFYSLTSLEKREKREMRKKIIVLTLFGISVCLMMSIDIMLKYN